MEEESVEEESVEVEDGSAEEEVEVEVEVEEVKEGEEVEDGTAWTRSMKCKMTNGWTTDPDCSANCSSL